jgi:hypothetical protein
VSHPYKAIGKLKIIVLYKLVSYLHRIWKIKYSVLLILFIYLFVADLTRLSNSDCIASNKWMITA